MLKINQSKQKSIESYLTSELNETNFKDVYLYYYLNLIYNLNYPVELKKFLQEIGVDFRLPFYFVANDWNNSNGVYDNFTVEYALAIEEVDKLKYKLDYHDKDLNIKLEIVEKSTYVTFNTLQDKFGKIYSLYITIDIFNHQIIKHELFSNGIHIDIFEKWK